MSIFPQRKLPGARVVITGASGGIGLALAENFAGRGAKLVLNARREEVLRGIAEKLNESGAEVAIAPGDITDDAVRRSILVCAQERFGGLDILVNNAGVGVFGRFVEAEPANLRRIMEVDFFATAELTRAAVPLLQRGIKPLVVNIGSILGHRGIPYSSEYCAAKFAVRGFSQAVRPELAKLGIGLLLVTPGTTDTGFFDNVLEMRVRLPWRKKERSGVSPALVARRTAWAVEHDCREIIPSIAGKALVLMNRLFPGVVDWWLSRYG